MRNLHLIKHLRQSPLPVSPREAECLVRAHLSNADIAQELGISVETVKNHFKNARAKLGADNRTAAQLLWLERAA